MNKEYTREDAVAAMYELKRQGFHKVVLELWESGELFLGCSHADWSIAPDIKIDSVEDWTTVKDKRSYRNYPSYWWVFD